MGTSIEERLDIGGVDLEVLSPVPGRGLGGKPRRWTVTSVHRLCRGASPDHVVLALAPPWTSSSSGPSPSRLTAIESTPG